MPIYVICKKCKKRIYLNVKRRVLLPEIFDVVCPHCGVKQTYSRVEVYEEIFEFRCPVCNGPFYIIPNPPLKVKCPHCKSKLLIANKNHVFIISRNNATWISNALVGAFIGATLGALASKEKPPIGAILGGLAGGILGAILDQKEAIYLDQNNN